MAKLARAVHVIDPTNRRRVALLPGEEPAPHLAALVTNPAAWEDGVLPDLHTEEGEQDGPAHREPCVDGSVCGGEHCPPEGPQGEQDVPDPAPGPQPDPEPEPAQAEPKPDPEPEKPKPAAKKTAAKTPARGRKAATQGDGGQ